MFDEIKFLLKKEILLELRNKYAISSVFLYLLSTIYICYLSFKQINQLETWSTLFWIIIIFTSINAVSKSFLYETKGRQLYLYSLVSPQALILSKLIYNILMMVLISLITLLIYVVLIGSIPLEGSNLGLFITLLIFGGSGFAGVLTLLAAISTKTNNNFALMAILGFPLILPLLALLNILSEIALRGLPWSYAWASIIILLALNLIVVLLSYLLFPYLWRD